MKIEVIRTRVFLPREDLASFVLNSIRSDLVHEDLVVVVTSKLASLAEGRTFPKEMPKEELVRRESDLYLGVIGHGSHLAVKQGLLMASAGIDESNSRDGDYIAFPQEPYKTASELRQRLMKAWGLKRLGVILSDSHTSPLRWGVTGVALSFAGFEPLRDCRGHKDLFGRPLTMTRVNRADALAAAAVLMMGEAAESTPLALISGAPVEFTDRSLSLEDLSVPVEEDLYWPVLKAFKDSNNSR